jgi:hypothetical protein
LRTVGSALVVVGWANASGLDLPVAVVDRASSERLPTLALVVGAAETATNRGLRAAIFRADTIFHWSFDPLAQGGG